jgi:hypothetical protein
MFLKENLAYILHVVEVALHCGTACRALCTCPGMQFLIQIEIIKVRSIQHASVFSLR